DARYNEPRGASVCPSIVELARMPSGGATAGWLLLSYLDYGVRYESGSDFIDERWDSTQKSAKITQLNHNLPYLADSFNFDEHHASMAFKLLAGDLKNEIDRRHRDRANMWFLDGHAQSMDAGAIADLARYREDGKAVDSYRYPQ